MKDDYRPKTLVGLYVRGADLIPDDVSRALHTEPTDAHARGELFNSVKHPAIEGVWRLLSDDMDSDETDPEIWEALLWICDEVRARTVEIGDIENAESAYLDVFIASELGHCGAFDIDFVLPVHAVAEVAKLRVPMWIKMCGTSSKAFDPAWLDDARIRSQSQDAARRPRVVVSLDVPRGDDDAGAEDFVLDPHRDAAVAMSSGMSTIWSATFDEAQLPDMTFSVAETLASSSVVAEHRLTETTQCSAGESACLVLTASRGAKYPHGSGDVEFRLSASTLEDVAQARVPMRVTMVVHPWVEDP